MRPAGVVRTSNPYARLWRSRPGCCENPYIRAFANSRPPLKTQGTRRDQCVCAVLLTGIQTLTPSALHSGVSPKGPSGQKTVARVRYERQLEPPGGSICEDLFQDITHGSA